MRLTHDPARRHASIGSRRRRQHIVMGIASAVAFAVVFWLDRWTSLPAIQHLYYLPIVAAALALGARGGLTAAAVAIALYHLANPHVVTLRYEESDLLQMAVFLAVGVVAARLADDTRRLRRLAMTDDLTGLHNLRSFELELNAIVRDGRVKRKPVALMVLDVDRLKLLNDQYGHLTGAEAVRTVGRLIAQYMPAAAIACRYGGDEFVIAVPNCPSASALLLADALRVAVQADTPTLAGQAFPAGALSISMGLVVREFADQGLVAMSRQGNDELGEALFRAADEALYVAKRGGRNRVHLSGLDSTLARAPSRFSAS